MFTSSEQFWAEVYFRIKKRRHAYSWSFRRNCLGVFFLGFSKVLLRECPSTPQAFTASLAPCSDREILWYFSVLGLVREAPLLDESKVLR